MRTEWISLLGQRDYPTDGLEDYSNWLDAALRRRGYSLKLVRVPWREAGWASALCWLWRESARWDGAWVVVQYVPLAWSRRAWPIGILPVLSVLRRRRARVAVVYHDPSPFPVRPYVSIPKRLTDRLKSIWQRYVMLIAHNMADMSILTVPLDRVAWLGPRPKKAAFIPVGANLPALQRQREDVSRATQRSDVRDSFGRSESLDWADTPKTVAVFGITDGQHREREIADIAYAMNQTALRVRKLELVIFGRGTEEAEPAVRRAFRGSTVGVSVRGLLPPEEIVSTLARSHALLFVRGHIATRRGTAIAGVSCGLPVVGYSGVETGYPMTEAGVMLVPQYDRGALATALSEVLVDEGLWLNLCQRSVHAHREFFSWNAIAGRFLEVLGV